MPTRRALRLPALLLAGGAVLSGCATAGQPAGPELAPDWKAAAYDATGCASRAAWVADGLPAADWDASTVSTSTADVTGDATAEVLVVTACPSAASEPGESVVVLDVGRGEPVALAVLGEGVAFQGATVRADGRSLTVAGPAAAGADPTCCPGHWASLTYAWTGSAFVLAEQVAVPTTRPVLAAQLPDGEHVGLVRAVTGGAVYVDPVEWFEGPDAAAACAADGVHDNGWEQCSAYHARDVDDEVVVLPVRAGAPASYVDPWTGGTVEVASVAELAGTPAVSAPGEHAYVRLTVAGGEVTALAGIYVP
ncbi:hypothetical protein [Trujillonella humicola]|uniref:hypothetical protein n=1 Tax=Trujillonella humicola TaxID=3383699 RepID=UPI0039068645